MKDHKEHTKLTERIVVRATKYTKQLLAERAKKSGTSINMQVANAIALYLTDDTFDESLFIARFNDMQSNFNTMQHELSAIKNHLAKTQTST